jgi:hypothetical protein
MLAFVFWERALAGRPWCGALWAVALGIVLFAATFLAFNVLAALGFLAPAGIAFALRSNDRIAGARRLAACAAVALGVAAGCYVALHLGTGFDPIAALRRALLVPEVLAERLPRPYGWCLLFDVYLFLLGLGFVAVPLLLAFLRRWPPHRAWRERALFYPYLGLVAILAVDLSGLLPGEVPRLWLFLMPFAILPAAKALAYLDRRERWALYAAIWCALVVLKANLFFFLP